MVSNVGYQRSPYDCMTTNWLSGFKLDKNKRQEFEISIKQGSVKWIIRKRSGRWIKFLREGDDTMTVELNGRESLRITYMEIGLLDSLKRCPKDKREVYCMTHITFLLAGGFSCHFSE